MSDEVKQQLGPNQELWLSKLESGEYKQGKMRLRNKDNEYCCLGVAVDLFPSPNGVWVLEDFTIFYHYNTSKNKTHCGVTTHDVVQALSLFSILGDARTINTKSLSELNDGGKTFKEIATIIRSDPSVYFREPR